VQIDRIHEAAIALDEVDAAFAEPIGRLLERKYTDPTSIESCPVAPPTSQSVWYREKSNVSARARKLAAEMPDIPSMNGSSRSGLLYNSANIDAPRARRAARLATPVPTPLPRTSGELRRCRRSKRWRGAGAECRMLGAECRVPGAGPGSG
jgi:hypothetical protein